MQKKRFQNIVTIALFMAIIILPTFIWYTLSLHKTLDFDLGEKRNKATLSNVINIENFSSEYEKYYNDRLPFRSSIITLMHNFDSLIEKPYINFERALFFSISKKIMNDSTKKDANNNIDRAYMDDAVDIYRNHKLKKTDIDPYVTGIDYPIKKISKDVILGQSDWMYLDAQNIPYYLGTNIPTLDEFEVYRVLYTSVTNLCKLYNKQIIFLICPEKEEIYPEYMPTMDIENEKERPIHIKEYLSTTSNAIYIYPKDEICEQKENYRLYYKYDSHWNVIGAYIAANAIKKELGIENISLNDLAIKRIPEFSNDLLYLAGVGDNAYNDSFGYEIDYKSDAEIENYIDSTPENIIIDTKSNSLDNRHVLVLGDSYAPAISQFFSRDFSRLTLTTIYNIDNVNIINAIKDADIIIVQAVERNEAESIPLICKKIMDTLYE